VSLFRKWEDFVGAAGLGLVLYGQYRGLFGSPADGMMGDVTRILHVHVPAAWLGMLCLTFAFFASVMSLWTGKRRWDLLVESSAEVGVVLVMLTCILGAIFAKPTWGRYWTWDPRVTSAAVLGLAFAGVLLLRSVLADPERRATWTAVASILASVNVPITYFSVQWWRSIHQLQSSPSTMSPEIVTVMRMNAVAFLLLSVFWITKRYRLAERLSASEAPDALPPELPVGGAS
jgi:heme exporter protein C